MYYIVCGKQIVESQMSEPSQDELQCWADEQNAHVYVISGEHYGMSAEPLSEKGCRQKYKKLLAWAKSAYAALEYDEHAADVTRTAPDEVKL